MELPLPNVARFEDLFDKLELKAKELHSFLKYREPDTRMVLYFSLGYYSDQYSTMAEEALKKGEEYQATMLAARAMDVRRICTDLYGQFPDKDYYTGLWKLPKDIVTETPNEVLQQIATFCAQNIQYDPKITEDPKRFKEELKKALRSYKGSGKRKELIELLKQNFDDMKDQPFRIVILFELYLLLLNVESAIDAFSKEAGEAPAEEAETPPDELPSFMLGKKNKKKKD